MHSGGALVRLWGDVFVQGLLALNQSCDLGGGGVKREKLEGCHVSTTGAQQGTGWLDVNITRSCTRS